MRVAIAVILALAAHAQQSPGGRPEFEAASVKPGDPNDPSSGGRATPGGLELRNATLKTLVRNAYDLNEYQLEGGPKWMDSAKFNVVAKLPAGAARDQINLMMQSLLADRFQLEVHRATKNLPEYALVVAKNGPRLKIASEEDMKRHGTSQGPRQIRGWGMPVSTLASMLISAVGAPVIDHTGLTGDYTFLLVFASVVDPPKEDETLPTIFAVLQEQLGLKLEPIKGTVEVLVIDRAQMPTEN